MVAKDENARHQHFLLFPTCFKNTLFSEGCQTTKSCCERLYFTGDHSLLMKWKRGHGKHYGNGENVTFRTMFLSLSRKQIPNI